MAAVIELEDLPRTDRVELLRSHLLAAAVPLELVPDPSGEIRVRSSYVALGRVNLGTTRATGAAVRRTPRLARDGTEPRLVLGVLAGGSSNVSQNDHQARLGVGDLAAFVTTDPFEVTYTPGTVRHTLQIPLRDLGLPDRFLLRHVAVPLAPGSALGAVVFAYTLRLAAAGTALTPAERRAAERPTVDLVRALLTTAAGDEDAGRGSLSRTLGPRVVEHMRLHLADPDLNAASIAAAHGISERYLYVILARMEVSLGRWIREHRLAAAARTLASPAGRSMTVATVAHQWGFADHAHFSREFRKQYGTTPRDWQERAATSHGE